MTSISENGPSAPIPDAPWAPDGYHVLGELGRGGMADVFLAVPRDGPSAHQTVVIKRIRPELADDEDFLTMFRDEARLAMRLEHPNVVRTFEAGRSGGIYFHTMEFLDGQPLGRLWRRGNERGDAPLSIYLRVLADVLSGLEYVHNLRDDHGVPMGIVHRDVTPPNVLVGYDGTVKLLDFGIAKAATRLTETRAGVVKGKLCYLAPEVAVGKTVDARADLFSVGVMLWEAIQGQRLWEGIDEYSIFRRLESGRLPLDGDREVQHPLLGPICAKALALDPSDRFRTAGEMRRSLYNVLIRMGEPARLDVSSYVVRLFFQEMSSMQATIKERVARIRRGSMPPPAQFSRRTVPPPLPVLPEIAPPAPTTLTGLEGARALVDDVSPFARTSVSRKVVGAVTMAASFATMTWFVGRPRPVASGADCVSRSDAVPAVAGPGVPNDRAVNTDSSSLVCSADSTDIAPASAPPTPLPTKPARQMVRPPEATRAPAAVHRVLARTDNIAPATAMTDESDSAARHRALDRRDPWSR